MLGLAYIALIFWGLVYVLRIYLSRRQLDALPYTSTRTPRPRTTFRNSHTTLTLEPLRIHISTKLLNRFHERMLRVLHTSSSRGSNVSLWMGLIYDAGSLAGALGQLGALGLALWTVWQLVIRVLSPSAEIMVEPSTSPVLAPQGFMRRAIVSEVTVSSQTLSQDVSLQIIIPGVTVPLSHLLPLLLALFSCQVIHEAGHAVAAAITGISIHSVGAYLTVLIPAAFVSLSSDALDSMRVRDKLRVIAAGSFHNLLFYAILSGLAWSGVNSAFVALLGYSDVGGLGLVVARIEEASVLVSHFPLGSIVTHLDDTPLSWSNASLSPESIWERYLTLPSDSLPVTRGWCANARSFSAQPTTCCPPNSGSSSSSETSLSCFVPLNSSLSEGRCMDPVQLMVPSIGRVSSERCHNDAQCVDGEADFRSMCLTLEPSETLMRIVIREPPWTATPGGTRVVLWSGPREEIWEQVTMTRHQPRSAWMPLELPYWLSLGYDYLKLVTLSLYLFNLLPLPYLDGAQLLSVLVVLLSSTRSVSQPNDLQLTLMESALSLGQGSHYYAFNTRSAVTTPLGRYKAAEGVVQAFTGTIMCAGAVLGLIVWLRNV